jgi:hypothetical protein
MDMRRLLPLLLLVFAALFILPQLFRGGDSKTLSAKDRGTMTKDAIERIDRAERKVFATSGRYTDRLAELVARDRVLASELTVPLVVDLDVTANGKGYLARVSSDVISVARARVGARVVARSCRELKSRSSADCPQAAKTTTTSTTTPPTTSG